MNGKKGTQPQSPTEVDVENRPTTEESQAEEDTNRDVPQFEREFGAHNRDRKSGWKGNTDRAHSVEDEEKTP